VSAIGTLGTVARFALGSVRLLAGSVGLFAPAMIIGRFGDEQPGRNPAAIYGLRLFGVRTVLIGADLFRLKGRELDHALRVAPVIHASDMATVLALWKNKQLAPERARPLALLSGANTLFAVAALVGSRRRTG
jgi:hypothetical protein